MNHRFAVVGIMGVLVAIGVPFFLASQFQIGSYAKSPQTVELTLGAKALIAGGRAKLWYAGGSSGGDFEISCQKDGRYVSPEGHEKYDCCGVAVTLLDVDDKSASRPPRAKFKVEWVAK